MIENLGYNNCTQQLNTVVKQIISVSNQYNWTSDYHLTSIFKSLETYSKALIVSYDKSRIDSDLEEKAMLRYQKVDALRSLLMGYIYHPDYIIKKAACKIKYIVDLHAVTIENENPFTSTSHVKYLLKDLVKPSIVSLMDPLSGVIALCDELYFAQLKFNETLKSYQGQLVQEDAWENVNRVKNVIVNLIDHKLTIYLKTKIQEGKIQYTDLVLDLVHIIIEARCKSSNINSNVKTTDEVALA